MPAVTATMRSPALRAAHVGKDRERSDVGIEAGRIWPTMRVGTPSSHDLIGQTRVTHWSWRHGHASSQDDICVDRRELTNIAGQWVRGIRLSADFGLNKNAWHFFLGGRVPVSGLFLRSRDRSCRENRCEVGRPRQLERWIQGG